MKDESYSVRVGLVRLELGMVRVLDEDVTATELGRRAVAEVVDHRNGSTFIRHLQERLQSKINNLLHPKTDGTTKPTDFY